MDPRTGLGLYRFFTISNYRLMEDLIGYIRTMPVEDILEQPDVAERVERYFMQGDPTSARCSWKTSQSNGNVLVLDTRGMVDVPQGNRFTMYSLFPECNVSIQVLWGRDQSEHGFFPWAIPSSTAAAPRTSGASCSATAAAAIPSWAPAKCPTSWPTRCSRNSNRNWTRDWPRLFLPGQEAFPPFTFPSAFCYEAPSIRKEPHEQTSALKSDFLLLITALIWGTAFVFQKTGMDYLGPFSFNRHPLRGSAPWP